VAGRNAINSAGASARFVEDDMSEEDETAAVGRVRIFVFKSETKPDLHAFADDLVGSKLPSQFKPWRATGAIAPDRKFPYNLSREAIEAAIRDHGYQLWRVKKSEKDN
jgi:hypothetical protein